jgi:sulfate transport system substrate-binding protein
MRAALAPLSLLVVVGLAVTGCGSGDNAGSATAQSGGTIDVVGYSPPEAVYQESLEPAFEKSPAGESVSFSNSFGASGDQSRAVAAGQAASVVHLAQAGDMERLVEEGEVAASWDKQPHNGIAQDSVVVIMTREGNPDGIKSFDDLLSKDVEVITPNPFTSGGAQWNIMAAYGAQLEQGKSDEEAIDYLKELFLHHVPVQDKSAREALATFMGGKGDVMLAYENEALFAQQRGQELDYVVPDQTILIENPVAVVNTSKNPQKAQAFVDYLYTPEAQKIFGEKGYRPVVPDVLSQFDYPDPPGLFTIEDVGGWPDVRKRFFDREQSIFLDIENELGVPTDD